jgi:hypothetical protein
MRHFLSRCAALSAILAGCLLAARTLGIHQAPLWHAWLVRADGTPCERACLFGVTPDGALSFEAASERLSAHPITHGATVVNRGLTMHWRTSEFELSIGHEPNSDQLAWINLQIKDRALRVRDLLAAYGTPDYVSAVANSIVTDLLYAQHGLQASVLRKALPEGAPLRLSSRVYNIYLVAPEPFAALLTRISNLRAWRGLGSIAHYLKP